MAPTKKCPSCGTEVPLETLHCPNCPASFDTEESDAFSRRRRQTHVPQPLLWGLAAAVLALGMWRVITFVLAYADTEAKSNPIDQMTQSLSGTSQSASDAAMALVTSSSTDVSSGSAPSAEPPPDADQETALPPDESEAIMISHDSDAAPRSNSRRRRAKRKSDGDSDWRLRGTVYDLVTLQPIAGVQVSLKDPETARKVDTITDAHGRYRFAVPALPGRGYSVVFTSGKYAPSYVDPDDEKVRQRGADERKKLAAQLARELDPPYPVEGLAGEPVTTDFYLAPRD